MPDPPWTQEYADVHRGLLCEALDDPALIERFRDGRSLPREYGRGLDERVVEYPWLVAQGLEGRVLDAGSTLNHEHVLDRVLGKLQFLHIVTLKPEATAFTNRSVSYIYSDLRDLPLRDDLYDLAVSVSTLEHIGMDNAMYGAEAGRDADPRLELRRAVAELRRVVRPGGRILATVPYGHREDHGWFRQFDAGDVEQLVADLGGSALSIVVYAYDRTGWNISDLDRASTAQYRDYLADPSPVADKAAAARAVACISVMV